MVESATPGDSHSGKNRRWHVRRPKGSKSRQAGKFGAANGVAGEIDLTHLGVPMTKAEYIKTIRDAADAYIKAVVDERTDYREALIRWQTLRGTLGPWAARDMADAWLEKNGGAQ